ncbi:hypothetical protein C2W62_04410 [Candidatus Entotheonella serta]|nr:hypothetical protein C2W62_04410 [Candidatus Entotheonella serta]
MRTQLVRVPASIESLVHFVEETDPDEMLSATVAKLQSGVSSRDLLAGAALAVARSTDLPPGHHGGPVHPLACIHAVYHLSERLSGEKRLLPVVQNVVLANRHIHHPAMGPYLMPEMEPLAASALPEAIYNGGSPGRVPDQWLDEDHMIAATKESFLKARGFTGLAEHHLLWLLPRIPREDLLDLILTDAIPKNELDDHYFLFPTFTWRAVELLGWDYAPILLRTATRYAPRPPAPPAVDWYDALFQEYELLDRPLRQTTGPDETAAVEALGDTIGACNDHADIPTLISRALADGLSLEGCGESLSIGAATLYLRSAKGNPMDVHLHTGVNTRRYLLRPDSGLSLRHKLILLMNWHTGPEVRNTVATLVPTPDPDPARVDALPHRDQDTLLDAIVDSIHAQPHIDLLGVSVGKLRAAPEVQETVSLTQQYANLGYDPYALFLRLGEVACRDNFTDDACL